MSENQDKSSPWELVCDNYDGYYSLETSRALLREQAGDYDTAETCHYCYKEKCDWLSFGDPIIEPTMEKVVQKDETNVLIPYSFCVALSNSYKGLVGSIVPRCVLNNFRKLFPNKQVWVEDTRRELMEDEYSDNDPPVWGLEHEAFFDL